MHIEYPGSRFLRARKFDLPKAKEMLLNAEQWRIDFKVDEIVQNFEFKEKAEVDKYYPQFYHNTDRVCFLDPKKNIIIKIIKSAGRTPDLHRAAR